MTFQTLATLNVGSSSLKFSVYEWVDGYLGPRRVRGSISDRTGSANLSVSGLSDTATEHFQSELRRVPKTIGHQIPALAKILSTALPGGVLTAIGHRVVHGGQHFDGPVRATPDVLKDLTALSIFAPDHQPYNLEGVLAIETAFPDLPQSLSFDTAFHRTQPHVATRYAIPRHLSDNGLIRYGFHGLNYAWVSSQLPNVLAGHPHEKTIVLHLGSGASLCALSHGKSIATSMGLTALSGIPMATRSGDVDPGLILNLIGRDGASVKTVEDLLTHKSGLLGMSGISADMQTLLSSSAPEAKEAIDLFVYRILGEIGSLQAALEGLDAIIFTGGIGENSAEIRRRICHGLHWTGMDLNHTANKAAEPLISSAKSNVSAAIIPADEETIIAQEAVSCCAE